MKTCKTCIWWDTNHPRLLFAPKVSGMHCPGFCRKHKPGAYSVATGEHGNFAIGIQPITDGDEGCAEHRESI